MWQTTFPDDWSNFGGGSSSGLENWQWFMTNNGNHSASTAVTPVEYHRSLSLIQQIPRDCHIHVFTSKNAKNPTVNLLTNT